MPDRVQRGELGEMDQGLEACSIERGGSPSAHRHPLLSTANAKAETYAEETVQIEWLVHCPADVFAAQPYPAVCRPLPWQQVEKPQNAFSVYTGLSIDLAICMSEMGV